MCSMILSQAANSSLSGIQWSLFTRSITVQSCRLARYYLATPTKPYSLASEEREQVENARS